MVVLTSHFRIGGDTLMNMLLKCVVLAAVCTMFPASALAGPVLTFEGLKNHEQVADYYNGGSGSLGSGPGPDYGITFSGNAMALVRETPFPGDPSPPTVLLLGTFGLGAGQPLSMTMDVLNGFANGLIFYDIVIGRPATVQIFSGLDGAGTLLAQQTLPITVEAFGSPSLLPFSGTAQSVVFTGGNLQLALDDITFAASAVPEPATWTLWLTAGLASLCLIRRMQP
jgi:hypothetical protein